MRPTTLVAAVAALAVPAFGELAVTLPIASTTCSGGQRCTVTWQDNTQRVSLAQQGNCTIALYIGSQNQQTFLQPIAFPEPVNVATTRTIDFTVDPTVGENSKSYFIRFSSTTLKDGANPYLSFSPMFTLDGMTGTFNQTVKNQIQGLTSSSTGATATGSGTGATTVSTSTRGGTTSAAASRPASASASASASNKNGTGAAFVNASPVTYTGVAAFIGAVVGLFL